ncbi:MAG: hypothetical protein HC904_08385 [Blastochloris sp.]|nr:hypothetical protein [Blastochloris sp.]
MAARRPNRRRTSSPRAKNSRSRRGSSKGTQNLLLGGVLILSLVALGFSLWLLNQERGKTRETATLSEKARLLTQQNPDAEALAGPSESESFALEKKK